MATWQFDLEVVPRTVAVKNLLPGDDHVTVEALESAEWWKAVSLAPGFLQRVETLLPWTKPWAAGWQVFGEEDGNRVDVIEENGKVAEVRLRLDARNLEVEFLDELLGIIESSDCALVTPTGRLVEPEIEAIWVELELSPAASFVRDPAEFLARARKYRKGN